MLALAVRFPCRVSINDVRQHLVVQYIVALTDYLLSKQPSDPPQDTVLLRIVWMVLTWYLQNGRKSLSIGVNSIPYPFCNLSEGSAPSDLLRDQGRYHRTC